MISSANYPENAISARGGICATGGFVAISVV